MYFLLFITSPADAKCDQTRYWCGFMALTCWIESHFCIGMGYGGYVSDSLLFPMYWLLHLVGGCLYIACTIGIPYTIFSSEGEDCKALNRPVGNALVAVYYVHAGFFMVYVASMLSITYFSFIKSTFIKKTSTTPES